MFFFISLKNLVQTRPDLADPNRVLYGLQPAGQGQKKVRAMLLRFAARVGAALSLKRTALSRLGRNVYVAFRMHQTRQLGLTTV